MSTHVFPTRQQPIIHENRFCRNGQPVSGRLARILADQTNHCLAFRRKAWLVKAVPFSDIAIGLAGGSGAMYFAGHTGHGVEFIEALVVMAEADSNSATDPYVDFLIADGISGGTNVTSTEAHFGMWAIPGVGGSPPDTPERFHFARINTSSVTSDTLYRGVVRVQDYARLVSCTIFEVGKNPVDTTDGAVDPRVGGGGPILDEQISSLLSAQTDMWRHNAGTVLTYTHGSDAAAVTHTGTSWTNPFDSTTTVSSSTVGHSVDLQYHNSESQSTVQVKMVVRAERTAGAGTVANNGVRVTDGTNSLTVTGIDNTTDWFQVTGTMPATNSQKWDIQMKTDAADTLKLQCVSVFEYEA